MISHKKTLLFLGCLVTFYALHGVEGIFGIPHALAQATSSVPVGGTILDMMGNIAYINNFMHVILFIMLWILQYLLSSAWFSDPGMMDFLHNIWVFSRDIMNVIFALMLIGVAFYTIIMADSKFVKGKIVSFVLAVILVNFSWFFPRVILDVSNVLTATIFNLPNAMPGGADCQTWVSVTNPVTGKDENVIKECEVAVHVDVFPTTDQKATCNAWDDGGKKKCDCNALTCIQTWTYKDALASGFPMSHATINGLALSFAKLQTMTKVPRTLVGLGSDLDGKSWTNTQFLISTLTVFFLQLMMLLPLIALGVALFIRTLVLWVTMAFMPFAFLGFVVGGKLGTGGIVDGLEDYIWKNFIGAAFLPAKVALPISIGFIMLTASTRVPVPDLGITLGVPIISGVGSIWGFMWMIIAGMVIWKGAFAALSTSEFSKGITDKIKGFGETVGGAAAKLPLLTPVPLPGLPPGANLGTLKNMGSSAIATLKEREEGIGTGKSFSEQLAAKMGGGGSKVNEEKDNLALQMKNDNANIEKLISAMEAAKNKGDYAPMQQLLPSSNIRTMDDAMKAAQDVARIFEDRGGISPRLRTFVPLPPAPPPAAPPPAAPPAGP